MFDFESLLSNRPRHGKDVVTKAPDKGATRFIFLAYTHFAKLVGLNMIFLLFCIPVITIPAALSGMNRVCLLLIREGVCSVWTDFVKEFKASFMKSLPLGILFSFLYADAAFCVLLGLSSGATGLGILLFIAAAVLCISTVLAAGYTFAIMPLMTLRNIDILRDAVLLLLRAPKTDLALLLMVGGWSAATVLLAPYSIPVIAVFGIALLSLAVSTILNPPIQKHIIDVLKSDSE
jgi:hypothetical protein